MDGCKVEYKKDFKILVVDDQYGFSVNLFYLPVIKTNYKNAVKNCDVILIIKITKLVKPKNRKT